MPVRWCLPTLMFLAFAGGGHAVEFDERLKVPTSAEPAAFRVQAEAFSSKAAALQAAGPERLMTDPALSKERFDLLWQLQQALDSHRPVGDLASVGFARREDGSYEIDYAAHPEWHVSADFLASYLPIANWGVFDEELRARGFKDTQLTALHEYVRTHDANRAARLRALPLAISFSRVVKKYDRLKLGVPDSVVLSYIYQRTRAEMEARREWASALFSALDAQHGRILSSYFAETRAVGIIAADDRRSGIDELLRIVRLPHFEELATTEAEGATP
jgi:hypothetical protein